MKMGLSQPKIFKRNSATISQPELSFVHAIYNSLHDSSHFLMVVTNTAGVIQSCNKEVTIKLGYAESELVGLRTPVIFHDPEEVRLRAKELTIELGREIEPGFEVFVEHARLGNSESKNWTLIGKDGRRFLIRLTISALFDNENRPIGFAGIGEDVTEFQEATKELRNSEARFQAFMDNTPAMAYIQDTEGKIMYANRQLMARFSLTQEQVIGKRCDEIWPAERVAPLRENDLNVMQSGQPMKYEEVLPTPDGSSDTWLSIKFPIRTDEGEQCLAGLSIDISDRKFIEKTLQKYRLQMEEANRRLERMVLTDGLTQVANRIAFDARLEEEIKRAKRYDLPLSLLFLDIDHFKSYNDENGHTNGDRVLKKFAELLGANSRPCDFVARFGGEEFVILLVNTALPGAFIAAERMRKLIETEPWEFKAITTSIGMAELTPNHNCSEDLVRQADYALYRAKSKGRNQVST